MNQHNESAPHANGACANCGTMAAGAYCHACGQRVGIHRLTLPHLLHEIPHAVFHVDRGLLATVVGLALHPGRMINGYLDGHRVRYFNPLSMLMILAGLCALVYAKFPFDYSPLVAALPAEQAAETEVMLKVLFVNYSLGLLLQLPVFALLSRVLMGGQRGYGEHLAINAFILAFLCVINLVLMPAYMLVNGTPTMPLVMFGSVVLYILYQVFALWDTFRTPGRWFGPGLRAVLVIICFQIAGMLLGVIGRIASNLLGG